MKRLIVIALILAGIVGILVVGIVARSVVRDILPTEAPEETVDPGTDPTVLYGRVTTVGGATWEGVLRFGRDQEIFWSDVFNGVRNENPWFKYLSEEDRPRENHLVEIFGVRIGSFDSELDSVRPFSTRFGQIARLDATATIVTVTLRNGETIELNRMDSSDFDDGLRVWDLERGATDLDPRSIRSIELFAAPRSGEAVPQLYGRVQTRTRQFEGFIRWSRDSSLGTDRIIGYSPERRVELAFEEIDSIEKLETGSRVTTRDGRVFELRGSRDIGEGNRGLLVDDPRYGRVLIPWANFRALELLEPRPGPDLGQFPEPEVLEGVVTTKAGEELPGQIVFDLDENLSIETLDAPQDGVTYMIPFSEIDSIISAEDGYEVRLGDGNVLQLEADGDLSDFNLGVLVLDSDQADYTPWTEVARIDFAASGP